MKSSELRSDEKIRSTAMDKMDGKMLSITARELVAAETHYDKSCYIAYTRQRCFKSEQEEKKNEPDRVYARAEHAAYCRLFYYIRYLLTLFLQPHMSTMVELTDKLIHFMNTLGVTVVKNHTKKHIRRRLETEFGESLHILPGDKGRLLVVPDNLSMQMLATEYLKVKNELDTHCSVSKDSTQMLKKVAMHLRCEVKKAQIDQPWPPQPEELNPNFVRLLTDLTQFLMILLTGDQPNKVTSPHVQTRVWSVAQDLVYGITGGTFLTAKHNLLPWAVKTLTGNVEL